MLKLTVVMSDEWNQETEEFVVEAVDIELEHSLASLSKWEEIWEIPLLSTNDKTDEQNFSYLECMCLTPNTPPEVFRKLTQEQQDEISDYLEKKHTATWFSESKNSRSARVITAEVIYHWMDSFNIDWQAQYWPLNKLLTLVQVHSAEQDDKSPRQRTRNRQADIARINAQRRAELGSKG